MLIAKYLKMMFRISLMSFDSAKVLAGVGAILAGVGVFGYVVPSIIGIILFLIGMLELANYFNDSRLRSDIIYWFIFGLIALILLASGIMALVVVYHPAIVTHPMIPYSGMRFIFPGLLTLVIFIIIAAVFFLLSAIYLRRAMETMSTRTNESLFSTGGLIYLIGAVLTFIVIGVFIIMIAWIIIGVALLSVKEPSK